MHACGWPGARVTTCPGEPPTPSRHCCRSWTPAIQMTAREPRGTDSLQQLLRPDPGRTTRLGARTGRRCPGHASAWRAPDRSGRVDRWGIGVGPDAGLASGRGHAGLCWRAERPGGPLLGVAVDDQVYALVVGRKVSLDGGDLPERRVVGPEKAAMPAPVEQHVPVRRESLVGASRLQVAVGQQRRVDVALGEVVAGRQAGFENQDRGVRLGEQVAVALDPHVSRALEGVDADERVTRMDEDLLVLLEPVIQGVPGDRDVPVEVGISKAARLGRSSSGGSGNERHVLAGERVDRHLLARLPDEHRALAVDDGVLAARTADPAGGRVIRQVVEGGTGVERGHGGFPFFWSSGLAGRGSGPGRTGPAGPAGLRVAVVTWAGTGTGAPEARGWRSAPGR